MPGLANAGSSAVSITAATFLPLRSDGSIVMPSRLSILVSAPLTIGDFASSPVPSSPTTRPNPVRWLSRTPAIVVRSLIRSACAGAPSPSASAKGRAARIAGMRMVLLERPQLAERAGQPAAALGVADVAAAGVLDLGVGDPRRRHRVVLGDVDPAHDAADVDVVLLGADHHDLGALDEQVAARQDLDHADRQGRGDRALALDLSCAGELLVTGRREQLRGIDVGVLGLERGHEAERGRQAVGRRVGLVERGVGLVARDVLLVDLDHEDVADPARVVVLEQPGRALGVQAAAGGPRALGVLADVELAVLGAVRRDVAGAAGPERGERGERERGERARGYVDHGASPTSRVAGATSLP